MAGKQDIDPAIFDTEVWSAVQHLMPSDRLHHHLRTLDRQFTLVVASDWNDPTLESRAHKIVSQAGMLGLTRMSQCARQVEESCRAGGGQVASILNCRTAVADIRLYALPRTGPLAGGLPPVAAT